MLIGNASAPRWYDRSLDRLRDYVGLLAGLGATATEIVVHDGPIDDVASRVHVPADHVDAVVGAFRNVGMHVNAHGPLTPEFRLSLLATETVDLKARYQPVLRTASEMAQRQQATTQFVLHSASGTEDDVELTAAFIDWAKRNSSGLQFAIELRQVAGWDDRRMDRSRAGLLAFVESFEPADVGICWDIANDWGNREGEPDWRVEPDADFLARVSHVHVHGVGKDGSLHHPLQVSTAPWNRAIQALTRAEYEGAVTMEVRYRHALACGEPWHVLAESYRLMALAADGSVPTASFNAAVGA